MLKQIQEPQALYQKQGVVPDAPIGMTPSAMPSSSFTSAPMPKKNRFKLIAGVIALVLVLAAGAAGILIAQRQKQLGNTAVAPNAPVSKPAAAELVTCGFCNGVCRNIAGIVCADGNAISGYSCISTTANTCISVPTAGQCAISFNVTQPTKANCLNKKAYLVTAGAAEKLLNANDAIPGGSTIKYVVEIKADGPTATDIAMKDTLPANLKFVKQDSSGGATTEPIASNPQILNVRFTKFAAAGTKKAIYYVQAAKTLQPYTFTNAAQVIDTTTLKPETQVAACTVTLKTAPDGQSTCDSKTAYQLDSAGKETAIASGAALEPGSIYYYRVKVKSLGTSAAPVTFKDVLPAGVEYVSQVTPTSVITLTKTTNTAGQTTLTGSLGTIGKTATVGKPEVINVEYKVKLLSSVKPGSYTNAATVTNGTLAAVKCPLHTVVAPPAGVATCGSKEMHTASINDGKPVTETRIADNSTLDYGREFYYRIYVKAAATTAGKVVVSDILPDDLQLVDAKDFTYANGKLTKTFDSLPGGPDSKILEFKVRVKAQNAGSIVTNNADVTTYKGTAVLGQPYKCSTVFKIAEYECNTPCSTTAQCKNGNNDYICSSSNVCRLGSNPDSTTCQPAPQTYACNSSCATDANCQTANAGYSCVDTADGKRCRLAAETSATNCQRTPVTYTCDSACTDDAQCQTASSSYVCSSNRCRLASNTASATCEGVTTTPTPTPTPGTPTPTPTPVSYTPTPVPVIGCNYSCSSNADCTNSSHICYSGRCRLETNVESETCSAAIAQATPTPVTYVPAPETPEQPVMPEQLPQTGPSDWINWLKAGMVTLGIGAVLLLLL